MRGREMRQLLIRRSFASSSELLACRHPPARLGSRTSYGRLGPGMLTMLEMTVAAWRWLGRWASTCNS